MTAVRSFWFVCDSCDEASGPGGVGDFDTRTAAWDDARQSGWRERPNGRHICGGCWDEEQR